MHLISAERNAVSLTKSGIIVMQFVMMCPELQCINKMHDFLCRMSKKKRREERKFLTRLVALTKARTNFSFSEFLTLSCVLHSSPYEIIIEDEIRNSMLDLWQKLRFTSDSFRMMGKISSKERRSNAISVTTFEKNGNIINWKKCTLLRPGLLSRLTNSLCSLLHYYWWASKSFQFFFSSTHASSLDMHFVHP